MGRITDALRRMGSPDDGEKGRHTRPKEGGRSEFTPPQPRLAGDEKPHSKYPKVLFGDVSPEVFTYYEIFPQGIEELRHSASTISHLGKKDFLVTSAQAGEGKTLFSINLAITLARYFSAKVLYIDADMRAPHSSLFYLDLPERKLTGFSDVLLESLDPDEAIVSTEIAGLFLMPRGKRISLDKIDQSRIGEVFSLVRDRFDFVLVDSAPVRIFSEPRLLARLCSATILVVRMNHTPRGSVKHAVQLLKDSGCSDIYFALNGIFYYVPTMRRPDPYHYYQSTSRSV